MDLELPCTEDGVHFVVVAIISRRQSGKSTFLAALAPMLAPPERSIIVSPVPALAYKLPQIKYLELHSSEKERVEKVFRSFMDGRHIFVLADEFDELCAQHGYVAPAVYDYVNYAGNYGTGIAICCRGTADITTNLLRSTDVIFIGGCNDPNAVRFLSDFLEDPSSPAFDKARVRDILKVLPKYVFMLWIPSSTPKFQGFWTVREGQIEPWDPDELRKPGPEAAPTDPGIPGPAASEAGKAASPGSTASGAAGRSPIGSGARTATTAGSSRSVSGSASVRPSVVPPPSRRASTRS